MSIGRKIGKVPTAILAVVAVIGVDISGRLLTGESTWWVLFALPLWIVGTVLIFTLLWDGPAALWSALRDRQSQRGDRQAST